MILITNDKIPKLCNLLFELRRSPDHGDKTSNDVL